MANADTLVSWDLSKTQLKALTEISPVETTFSWAITNAMLKRGNSPAVEAGDSSIAGYATSGAAAKESATYFVISFTIGLESSVFLNEMSYAVQRSGTTGPTNFIWRCYKDGTEISLLGNSATPVDKNNREKIEGMLSLSSLGVLSAGTAIRLELYVTSMNKSGPLYLKDSITLTGTATDTSQGGGGEGVGPRISGASDLTVDVGDSRDIALTISGDEGVVVSTNLLVVADGVGVSPEDANLTGSYFIEDGMLHIAPTAEDVGTHQVLAVLTVGDVCATNAFTLTVQRVLKSLATWTIESKSYTDVGSFAADTPLDASLTSAVVSRGDGAPAAGKQGTFGAKNFNVTTFEDAKGQGKYLEVTFDVADNYSLTPVALEYNLYRSSTGPTNFSWTCSTNGIVAFDLGNVETFGVSGTETTSSFSLDLSTIGILPLGVGMTLRLYAWGTSNESGSFCFNKDSIVLKGYDEMDPTVFIRPSIEEIEDQFVYVGDTNAVVVPFSGSMEYATATNFAACSENVSGNCWIAGGIAYYAPSAEDALLEQPLEFVVTLSAVKDEEKMDSTAFFNVTVREKPVLRIAKGGVLRENFDSMGTIATATLPEAWRVANTNVLHCTNALNYANAGNSTNKRATNSNGGISIINADIYNMGTNTDDRALGFLSSSGSSSPYRTCALMVPVKNVGAVALERLWISYSVEKWRNGNAKTLALYTSGDGVEWTEVGGEFTLTTTADPKKEDGKTDTTELTLGADPTIKRISEKVTLAMPLVSGEILYLGWFYLSNDANCGSAQALAIDDVEIAAGDIKMTTFVVQ
ncbi:MAG: hypothetical protein ILM98_12170 [Kiritimatiellae bacterium]|nr:hypothetical protein [Kiritimatiellia bacterium]